VIEYGKPVKQLQTVKSAFLSTKVG